MMFKMPLVMGCLVWCMQYVVGLLEPIKADAPAKISFKCHLLHLIILCVFAYFLLHSSIRFVQGSREVHNSVGILQGLKESTALSGFCKN